MLLPVLLSCSLVDDSRSIHHVNENVKKSTSIHACILSPSHCRFLEHPHEIPSHYDPATTILLYPTADAVYLDDPRIDLRGIERVIVIEATWSKSDVVASHPSLKSLRRVKIRDHESTFWRYQELGRHFLSTLEAIYWTCEEFMKRRKSDAGVEQQKGKEHNIDDLLYLYAFQHERICERYLSGGEAAPRSWSGGAQDVISGAGAGSGTGSKSNPQLKTSATREETNTKTKANIEA
jgi:hypothetical protein